MLVDTDYLPIELIFNLLCICRRPGFPSLISINRALLSRGLWSGSLAEPFRLSFWLRLCQSASLLDEAAIPYPTLLAADWLAWRPDEQFRHLVNAWVQAPDSERVRQERNAAVLRIQEGAALTRIQQRETAGLQILGIYTGQELTPLGEQVLSGQAIPKPPTARWRILEDDRLLAPYPPDWALLWDLEAYLDPLAPGVYSLADQALRLASQRGALEGGEETLHTTALPAVLERGLGHYPPVALLHKLAGQPVIRVLSGTVLEFSSEEEMGRLRRSPAWRRDLEHLLSPRHVFLTPWQAPRVLRRLLRQGFLSEHDLEGLDDASGGEQPEPNQEGVKPARGGFSKADRVYLISLVLLAEGLESPFAPPPGLFAKLSRQMDVSLRASAARWATKALQKISPQPRWLPEIDPPPIPEGELIERLRHAIHKSETIDILYQASNRHTPEYRHVAPLLVEQRGERWYLIAYCHTRRANRTFRLDRMKIVDSIPGT